MVEEGYLKPSGRSLLLVAASVKELMQKMDAYKAPKIAHVINKVVR